MKSPIVVYHGPSWLDGAPIVALATLGSSNVKTGPMVQTWILRADALPTEASKAGTDSSVCGDCPRRHATGGDCYVTLFQAPRSVWDHWNRNGRPGPNWLDEDFEALWRNAQAHGVRLGSYGDPAAVPWTVWADFLGRLRPRVHTGYTHQWRNLKRRAMYAPTTYDFNRLHEQYTWLRDNVMASCDSTEDALTARTLGWRYFLALAPGAEPPPNTVLCLAERTEKARSCEECGICNGAQGRERRASVHLVEHGARSTGKHKRLAVLQ